MTERQIKLILVEKAGLMAKSLAKGKDLEVRKSASGVTVEEVSKKVISK